MVTYSTKDGKSVEDLPLRNTTGVTMEIEGVRTTTDFEVIEIMDDNNTYPALLGLD